MSLGLVVVLALNAAPISIDHRGTLGEALNAIATKGGINLIATGDLHVPAEVHFKDLTAEEALEALVKVHHLELHKEGKLWVVKPAASGAEPAGALAPPARPLPPVKGLPPLPPRPPSPTVSKDPTAEALEAEAEAAQKRAEEADGRADQLRERAEKLRDDKEAADEARQAEEEARQEEADARREEQQARKEEARARKDEMKARLDELKSKAKHGGHGAKTVATGPVTVPDGQVVDDVVSYGGPVTLGDGVVANGDVVAFGGDVVLGDGVVVNGDAVSFGGTIKEGAGAVVNGEKVSFGVNGFGVKSGVAALPVVKAVEKTEEHSGLAGFLIKFAAFFGLGFLLMMFAPNRMRNIEAEIKLEPMKSGLAGLLALMGSVPLTLLLVLTVIGIPVAVLMWLLGGLSILMGLLALANSLGTRFPVAKLRRTQAAVLAVGLLVMMLVGLVPVLGPLLISCAVCVSFGAIIRTRVGQRALGLPVPESSPIHEVGA
ncbi:MAG: hypothetical protein IPJ65_41865 [Archangiaceae bacterium]|nr:hypothetical protein [Archangiaceae bacterium]